MSITAGYAPAQVLNEWAKTATVKTIPQMFDRTVQKGTQRPMLSAKKGGQWTTLTYGQVKERMDNLSYALIELGVAAEDRVAQISGNRPEWVIADLGILYMAGVHVPIYPTLSADGVEYILNDCGAAVVTVAGQEHLDRVLSVAANVPNLKHILVYDAFKDPGNASVKIWKFDDILKLGAEKAEAHKAERQKRLDALTAEHVASLVYTSGTTGEPKGAMLMHGNFMSNCTTVTPEMGILDTDVELSFLPLCHVFERIAYYALVEVGAHVYYAESIDTVAANLLEVHPTIVPSVPRLFEKIHAKIIEGVESGKPLKKKIFYWALRMGEKARIMKQNNQPLSVADDIALKLATKLVFSKIHEKTGGNIRFFISGGAPLRRDIAEFFANVGLTICEGYGLTETSPVITMNRPTRVRFGAVGQPLKHVEVKIAEDGEILSRGPNTMRGYFNKPDQTREVIDSEGWFHTGDIGNLDKDNFLTITDRKKEILVMSNGKNVAPQPIENLLKSSTYIEQAMIIGDNRNFISALVVPNFVTLEAAVKGLGISGSGPALARDPKVLDFLQKQVTDLCKDLSQYEKVKKIAVLEQEFTQDAGELTPTLKFKRRVIIEKNKDKIEGMYTS